MKKEMLKAIFQALRIIPTLFQFAAGENILVGRFIAIDGEEEDGEWINVFMKLCENEIFWIQILIPKIGKALISLNKFKPTSI